MEPSDEARSQGTAIRPIEAAEAALAENAFRARFHLTPADITYLRSRGGATIGEHAARFIRERLAPAHPVKDGKQTPWRGHPVFVAQHATATCCRSCLAKWHWIPAGQPLTPAEQAHCVQLIMRFIAREYRAAEGGRG